MNLRPKPYKEILNSLQNISSKEILQRKKQNQIVIDFYTNVKQELKFVIEQNKFPVDLKKAFNITVDKPFAEDLLNHTSELLERTLNNTFYENVLVERKNRKIFYKIKNFILNFFNNKNHTL